MSASPTQRTMALLRELGYVVHKVEYWSPYAGRRIDLFGLFDVLAVGNGETIAVQCTTDSNVSSRVRKIADSPIIGDIRKAGWKLFVHGWKKKGRRWVLREVDVS